MISLVQFQETLNKSEIKCPIASSVKENRGGMSLHDGFNIITNALTQMHRLLEILEVVHQSLAIETN